MTPQSIEEIAVQNEIALVQQNNQAFVSSREIAVKFGKQHKDVMRIIHNYLNSENMNDFNERNFALNSHTQAGRAKRGRPRLAEILMTRDGFALTVMSMTGARALVWKVKFLDAFNQMERVIIEQLPALRAENAALKAAIEKKALPGKRTGMISVPKMETNLWGELEAIRWELHRRDQQDELTILKSKTRHMRKMLTGLTIKFDALQDKADFLEGKKTAKIIKLLKSEKDYEPSEKKDEPTLD